MSTEPGPLQLPHSDEGAVVTRAAANDSSAIDHRQWLSGHIFFTSDIYGTNSDEIVRNVVGPFIDQLLQAGSIERYFFIRYGEGGPHIRLRMFGPPDILEGLVKPALEDRVRRLETGGPGDEGSSMEGGSTRLRSLQWIPYEPEVRRYGGAHGVPIAERIFHASSELALAQLRADGGGDRSARLGKALLAMLVTVFTFFPERTSSAELIRGYEAGYLKSVVGPSPEKLDEWRNAFSSSYERQAATVSAHTEWILEKLQSGESLTPIFDRYQATLARHRDTLHSLWTNGLLVTPGNATPSWHQCLAFLTPSYLHMMNNRLGVPIREESYLAHLIQRAMSHEVH